jgi:uncharacterized protein (DUF1778 family)
MAAPTATRETTISLRASASQRALIDQAAQVQGKTRTDFMLEAAYEKAQQVLLDRTVFALDAKSFERFVKLFGCSGQIQQGVEPIVEQAQSWERLRSL